MLETRGNYFKKMKMEKLQLNFVHILTDEIHSYSSEVHPELRQEIYVICKHPEWHWGPPIIH
jgi:hypothetical protein